MDAHATLFVKTCQFPKYLGSADIEWNIELLKLTAANAHGSQLKRKILLHRFLLLVLLSGGINKYFHASFSNEFSSVDQMLLGVALIVLLWGQFYLTSVKTHSQDFCTYVNGLKFLVMKNTSTCAKSEKGSFETVSVFLGYIIYISTFVVPVAFIYGLHSINPCKPSLAGYFLLFACQDTRNAANIDSTIYKIVSHFMQFCLLLLNHWFWAFGFNVAGFVFINLMILCNLSFVDQLKR